MRIDNFSWVMLSTYFVFITNNEYLQVFEVIKNQKSIIFLDGWCPMCQKFGKFVTKFDVLKLVTLENIRITDAVSSMSKERGLKEMVTINKLGKVYYGFNSVFQISLHIPLFWILFHSYCY